MLKVAVWTVLVLLLGVMALALMGIAGAVLTGCTVDYACDGCTVRLAVPIPDCIIYDPKTSSVRSCPDAGTDAARDSE